MSTEFAPLCPGRSDLLPAARRFCFHLVACHSLQPGLQPRWASDSRFCGDGRALWAPTHWPVFVAKEMKKAVTSGILILSWGKYAQKRRQSHEYRVYTKNIWISSFWAVASEGGFDSGRNYREERRTAASRGVCATQSPASHAARD